MIIYEVFYIDYEHIDSNIFDDDGYHDDYFDYDIEIKKPVKYFDTEEKAFNYIKTHTDKEYYYHALEVE